MASVLFPIDPCVTLVVLGRFGAPLPIHSFSWNGKVGLERSRYTSGVKSHGWGISNPRVRTDFKIQLIIQEQSIGFSWYIYIGKKLLIPTLVDLSDLLISMFFFKATVQLMVNCWFGSQWFGFLESPYGRDWDSWVYPDSNPKPPGPKPTIN